ncbi:hypothetical protein [Chamaesiphon sp.]|uniref:hypothetical protein n=1 Tax=Chamaesiphon sp. TaxID=2814140 RepID=UPI003593CBF4
MSDKISTGAELKQWYSAFELAGRAGLQLCPTTLREKPKPKNGERGSERCAVVAKNRPEDIQATTQQLVEFLSPGMRS